MLTDVQVERYSRQLILPQVGGRRQEALLSAAVLIAGSGTIATTAGAYLAAAGVGRLTVVTAEPLVPTLPRLDHQNPDCAVAVRLEEMTAALGLTLAPDHNLLIDAGEDMAGALNGASVTCRRPLVWARRLGGCVRIAVLAGYAPDEACRACLDAPASSSPDTDHSLASVAAGFSGTLVAVEALRILLACGAPLHSRVITADLHHATVREAPAPKRPGCSACVHTDASTHG